jgi:5-formyltetrahydrofolate cyclo-ligase
MAKEDIRMRIWRLMEEKGIAIFPKPIFHRIPNFIGAEKAAWKLRELPEYKAAKVVFCNPDSPQSPVREIALKDDKIVVMATPRLKKGFLLLDPKTIPKNQIFEASTIHGTFKHGHPIEPSKVKIDLFVAGSVAVSLDGRRLGKGKGYSDQEYAILKNADSLSPKAIVVTTVHDVQIVEEIPRDEWDVPVDVIVTPSKIIQTRKDKKTVILDHKDI